MPEHRREQHVRKGSSAIDFLIEKERLESVSEEGRDRAADRLIHDASKRLRSAVSLADDALSGAQDLTSSVELGPYRATS